MKRNALRFIIAFTAVTITIAGCKRSENSIRAEIKDITESVYSSLSIQPDSAYDVFSTMSGIIEKVYVTEGDTVELGTALFQIRNNAPELNVASAKNNLELARLNAGANSPVLNNLRDDIRTAQLKFEQDSINYYRQLNLWSQQIGTKTELEHRKLSFESSKANVASLKRRLELSKVELATQLNNAQNSYLLATENTNEFLVQSEIHGVVYQVEKRTGELVVPQQKLAFIGKANNYILEMMIDETDITKIKVGQEIIVLLDAYKGEVFKATVQKIYPTKDERTQTFKVEGVFTSRPPVLYPGLTGEVNIVVNKKSNTLVLPNSYINESNQVRTEAGMIDISTGLSNMEFTEILSGIDSTTAVLPLE